MGSNWYGIPAIQRQFNQFTEGVKRLAYWSIIHLLAGITLGWVMFGCAPIKRHDRIVRKYPFVHVEKIDTIRDTLRIEIPRIKVDTAFIIDHLYDTITIEKERLKAVIYRVKDSIYVTAQCDTIYAEKIINKPYKVIDYNERSFWAKLKVLFIWLLVLGLLILLFNILWYYFTKQR